MDKIYQMELHETLNIGSYLRIIRVHGGWIYESETESGGGYNISSCFVPFNDECQLIMEKDDS